MENRKPKHRLIAILSADVVGYARLVEQDEPSTLAQFNSLLEELFDPEVRAHGGRIVKTMGDGLLIEFESAVEALECAIAIQRTMLTRNDGVLPDRKMEFRIGINVGEVVVDNDDIFGGDVNIAARLESLAPPGGICISARVKEDVDGRVAARFEDSGEHRLKNLSRPIRLYRVAFDSPARNATRAVDALDRPSIAVLPLQNMSGETEQDYFADAIAEDIVTALSRWRSLFVVARNSSFAYKGQNVDVRRIGYELGVRYVLEGSVRKVDRRVRVTAQLLETLGGTHIWADRFDRELLDILDLQDEITQRVVSAIEPALLQRENVRLGAKSLTDYSAFDFYQRGMWHLNRVSADGYKEAVSLFRQAIQRDPDMSLGYVGLSRILYGGATIYGWSERPDDDLRESFDAAGKAIALDPSEGLAYFAQAGAALYLGRHREALEAARHAVALNPNFAYANQRLGQVLIYSGFPSDAIVPLERCLSLSPFDPQLGSTIALLALAHYQSKNYQEAIAQAKAAIEQNFTLAYLLLAAALARLGRSDEARNVVPADLLTRTTLNTPVLASYARDADRDHFLGGIALAGVNLAPPAVS